MKLTRVLKSLVLTALWLFVFVPAWAQNCGKERWAVKTLADPRGSTVAKVRPIDTTVAVLVARKAPAKKTLLAADATRFPEEMKVYRVRVVLVGYKKEADSDFHVVIADRKKPWVTMIVEIPAGACAPTAFRQQFDQEQANFASEFSRPGTKFRRLSKEVPVVVTGVGFFDFIHGQTGVAPNGFELHPVLSITKD